MGLSCKPVGKIGSLHKKMKNELDKEKEKLKKTTKSK